MYTYNHHFIIKLLEKNMSFQIVNNTNEITLNEGWVNSTHFKSHGREVDAQGRRVNSDYQGHKYRIIAKQERYFSILERIERICQGIRAVISTFGRALQSKSTIHLFTKSKETVRFGVRDNFSILPPELLLKIFNMLSIKDRFKISPICKNFTQAIEAYLNINPLERLFYKNIKPVEFTQENRISNFLIRNASENTPKLIITSDMEEDDKNPVVKLWASDKPPVAEKDWKNFVSSMYKPIEFLAIGGTSSNLLAASQNNCEGLTQIWDLEKQKVLVTKKLNKTVNCLYPMEDLLWIGFENGKLGCYNFSDLSEIGGFQAHNFGVHWISGDPSIARLFTNDHDNFKIWDTQNPQNVCIKKISEVGYLGQIIYNSQLKLLIGVNREHSISIRKGEDGTEIGRFVFPDSVVEGLHFNADTGLLFASFQIIHNYRPAGAKIVVWDIHSKKLVTSFSKFQEYCFSSVADSHIDFDPESGLILTGGDIIGLWNLHDGKLVKVLPFPRGKFEKIIWDKKDHKLFVLKDRKLNLLDYSNSPFKVVTQ